jgi:hypothetical protein
MRDYPIGLPNCRLALPNNPRQRPHHHPHHCHHNHIRNELRHHQQPQPAPLTRPPLRRKKKRPRPLRRGVIAIVLLFQPLTHARTRRPMNNVPPPAGDTAILHQHLLQRWRNLPSRHLQSRRQSFTRAFSTLYLSSHNHSHLFQQEPVRGFACQFHRRVLDAFI